MCWTDNLLKFNRGKEKWKKEASKKYEHLSVSRGIILWPNYSEKITSPLKNNANVSLQKKLLRILKKNQKETNRDAIPA